MERTEHRVAIVVDLTYAERVIELARKCHTWLVNSPLNDPVAAALWDSGLAGSLENGITTFKPAESPEASFLMILETVEDHHGEYSHDPPLSVIEVIGADLSAAVRDKLGSHGFDRIAPAETGFVARRDSA